MERSGLPPRRDLPVGRVESLPNIRSLPAWIFSRSLRITSALYGLVAWDFLLGDSARFKMAASIATERMAASAQEYSPYVRMAGALSGRERGTGCGAGDRVPQNSFHSPVSP